MSTDLKGYNVFMTGGSAGLGFEMSKELLRHGATVVIGARGGERLDRALAELRKTGDAYAVPMDVKDEESVTKAAEWFRERFDHLDMLVNNAGIGGNSPEFRKLPKGYKFYDIPVSAVKSVIETNLIGYFTVTSRFLPMMVERGKGSLIYVSTSDRTMTGKGQIPYGPSKAGAEAMTAIMLKELEGTGVTVNIICPGGFTATDMATPDMIQSHLSKNQPVLTPDVMNRLILFMASEKSAGITGEKIIGKFFGEWLKERNIEFGD